MTLIKFFKMIALALIMVLLVTACGSPAAVSQAVQAPVASKDIAGVIERYRQMIPVQMKQKNIPGLAIAVVDDQGVLWTQGFGYTDTDNQTPVTPDTLFSIQSMSKSFTATAAMLAAQDGLVNLDAPITTYLPNFHVNSIFEEHPEQKITLRMLLSHTAGFAHETTYGGNYDHPVYSFEQHIASISDTWLKFPVGTRYSYSNLGIDLAGYILQVRAGMPFIQYVQDKILNPLGMKKSTLDISRVRADPARAIGHAESPFRPPVDFLLIPSGGVWTTAVDMARYLQFHIKEGAIDGKRLLREDLAETMYTPPNAASRGVYGSTDYALGITVGTRNNARHFQHGGGGFGFNSSMVWYPELKLGSVVLCNAELQDDYVVQLSEGVLDSMIASFNQVYTQRTQNTVLVKPAYLPVQQDNPLSDIELNYLIQNKALPADDAAQKRRSAFAGKYVMNSFGFPGETVDVNYHYGELTATFYGTNYLLTEVQPGLFFSPYGDALDLRGADPTLMNIRLVKADPQSLPARIAFYALCGMAFLSALFFWPLRALFRRIRRRSGQVTETKADTKGGRWMVVVSILAGLGALIGLLSLAVLALVPNLIYFPWPHPYIDIAWWQYALVGLPFGNLVLSIGIVFASIVAILVRAWGRATRWYTFGVALALLGFNLAIIIW